MGRWISRDPLDDSNAQNLLIMCLNNLINYLDLYGLMEETPVYATNFSPMFNGTPKTRMGTPDKRFLPNQIPVWLWEPVEQYDRYDWQKMRLTQELISLCPHFATERKNHFKQTVCCEPDICRAEAIAMAKSYTDALRFAQRVRIAKAGGFIGNIATCFLGGQQADGTKYPDDIYIGLTCGGWEEMARVNLEPITEKSNCWSYSTSLKYWPFTEVARHTWGELSSVHGSVTLDPWPSGGVTY